MTREAVVAEALSWQRTPYHTGARIKGVGCDCATFLIGVYSAVGMIEPFDPGYYPPDWHLHCTRERYLETVARWARRVEAGGPGDVVVWKFGRLFAHGGIIIEWPRIMHAQIGVGATLAEGNAAIFQNMIKGEPRPVQFWSPTQWG